MSRRRGRPTLSEPDQVHYNIRVVDGAEGQRLAIVQAQAILDVLTWWHEHPHDDESAPEVARPAESPSSDA